MSSSFTRTRRDWTRGMASNWKRGGLDRILENKNSLLWVGEALAQAVQRSCGYPIPGSVQGQVWASWFNERCPCPVLWVGRTPGQWIPAQLKVKTAFSTKSELCSSLAPVQMCLEGKCRQEFPPRPHVRTSLLQPTQGLGMLCCRASAAANPTRNLEKGTDLESFLHWRMRLHCWLHNKYFFL